MFFKKGLGENILLKVNLEKKKLGRERKSNLAYIFIKQ